jgi:hypothetical protein
LIGKDNSNAVSEFGVEGLGGLWREWTRGKERKISQYGLYVSLIRIFLIFESIIKNGKDLKNFSKPSKTLLQYTFQVPSYQEDFRF